MISKAKTPEQYIEEAPQERKEGLRKLRETFLKNIPKGFAEVMGYGMVGYAVPHSIYPAGYHCDPKLPLPFTGFASQKHFIAVYHMGIYSDPALFKWFTTEFTKQSSVRLDMGKSCIRFKKTEHIPYKLIGDLMKKITVKDWIKTYEKHIKR